jgi:hypothetical protein
MLRSPEFWSTIIAVFALILSQLPPVRELIKPRELRIFVPEVLALSHYMGNLQIWAFLALYNTGGRSLTVQKIECVIVGEDGSPWRLPAQTYTPTLAQTAPGQPAPELLMGWISLKPDENWAQTLRFYKVWSIKEEEDVTEISANIRTDINAKLKLKAPFDNNLVEAAPELVKRAKDFFEKKFTPTKGSYILLIAARSEKNEVLRVRGFEFTLFDNQIRSLRAPADDYKLGWGVCFPVDSADPSKGSTFIRLRPMGETEANREYAKLPPL